MTDFVYRQTWVELVNPKLNIDSSADMGVGYEHASTAIAGYSAPTIVLIETEHEIPEPSNKSHEAIVARVLHKYGGALDRLAAY